LGVIESMPIVVCHLACTNFSSNGGDAIEVVHSDSSADVAAADAPTLRGHDATTCLSGRDLSSFEFISVTRQGFVLVSLKLINNRLNIIM
jgi:hypothetical protein